MAKAEASSPGKNPKNPPPSGSGSDSATASPVIPKRRGLLNRLFGGSDPQPVETVRKAEHVHAVSQQTQVQDVQPRRKNLLQRIFTGDDNRTGKGKIVQREEGGSVAVMVTANNLGHVSAQPGATYYRGATTTETTNGVTTVNRYRHSVDSPNEKSTRFATMSDRDNPADRLAGINRSSDKKDFKQTITYAQSGNTVAGSVEGTTNPSSRKGAGKYGYTASSTETTDRNGDRYYQDQGKGFFEKGGALQRGLSRLNPFSKKETEVTMSGTGYRAGDQTKIGILAGDEFIMTDARNGKSMQIERSEVQRYLKDGQNVTLFRSALLKGENGKTETYAAYEVTQNRNDPSAFTFTRTDRTPGNRLQESGHGSVQLDGNGDLVTKTTGRNMTAGVKPEILGAAVNLSWFSQKNKADLELIRGKNGEIGVTSYTSTDKKVAVGIGAAITPLGGGPFAFVGIQGGKTTGDAGAAYTAKLIGPDGSFGEKIARVQAALEVKGFYQDPDGHARGRGHKNGSPTVTALDNYFANGGTVKELEKLANSDKIRHHPAVLAVAGGLHAETAPHMIARQDMQLYNGPAISVNGHTYSAEAVRKAQVQSVDSIDGPRDNQPIPRNLTTVMIADGNKLKGVDIRELGTYGYQISKGADSVIISVDKNNIHLDPTRGHMAGITITTIEDNHVGKTHTTTIQTPVSSLPDILHIPVILHGHKHHPDTPNNPNDPKIPNVPPNGCAGCPPVTPPSTPIPPVTPQGCAGCPGVLGKLFGR